MLVSTVDPPAASSICIFKANTDVLKDKASSRKRDTPLGITTFSIIEVSLVPSDKKQTHLSAKR